MRLQQRLLSEATLKDLDPTGMASAKKFFAAEFDKGTNGPQFATSALIYKADVSRAGQEQAFKYVINIYKLMSIDFVIAKFIIPAYYGTVSYFNNDDTLEDQGDLQLGIDVSMASEKTLQAAADSINFYYEGILPETLTTHFNGYKTKLTTAIATTKAAQNFTALGPLLKGSAKTAYDLIAAS
jgi:hypothetical protein